METNEQDQTPKILPNLGGENFKKNLMHFIIVAVMLMVTTIINLFLEKFIQPSSLVFVYLVPAMAGAIYIGIWASILSFTAGFLIFDFIFVKPYYTLHISEAQDVYNVTVYFIVAIILTYLINVLYRQNELMKRRLDRVSLLEDMSRDLLLLTPLEQTYTIGEVTFSLRATVLSQLGQIILRYVKMILDVPTLVFFREDNGSLKLWTKSTGNLEIIEQDNAAANWTFDQGEVSGSGTYTYSDTQFYFIPMKTIEGSVGVIGILYNSKDLFPEQRRLLGIVANLVTIIAEMWISMKITQSNDDPSGQTKA